MSVACDSMQACSSSDIFDTLIARRCIYPNYIFYLMERELGICGFLKARISASLLAARKHQGDHTFEHIYDELADILALSAVKRSSIMSLEIAIEAANIIPIQDNIDQLTVETILVSDMYLSDEIVKSFLRIAGIDDRHLLIKSSSGKSSGRLWASLSNHGFYFNHVGDCDHSDFRMATKAGMTASLTTISDPTVLEKKLLMLGLTNSAFFIREARLAISRPIADYQDLAAHQEGMTILSTLSAMQAEINLPFLIKLAFRVLDQCADASQDYHLSFSSRGSYLLFKLCRSIVHHMKMEHVKCFYWFSSRDARLRGSQDYLDYCFSLFGDQTIVIDLTGSGVSFIALNLHFCEETNAKKPSFFVGVRVLFSAAEALQICDRLGIDLTKHELPLSHCFYGQELQNRIVMLKLMNFSPEAKVLDITRISNFFLPVREPYEFGESVRQMVSYSCSYGIQLLEQIAPIIGSHYQEIRDDVMSEGFDCALRESIKKILCRSTICIRNFSLKDISVVRHYI